MLGDVVLETRFSDWREVDGLRVPMHIVQRLDNLPWSDLRLASTRVNADVGDLAAPAAVKIASPAAVAVNITIDSIAPGVWHLTGQSHHSVAIEMPDHMLLVEAPQNEARTLAVIERTRALRPGKPIRAVINTHHHFDHSGGIRAAMSEGLTIVTHSANAPFFKDLAKRQFLIVPDRQARAQAHKNPDCHDSERPWGKQPES